ncbi:MAG: hypothetical protein Tsb0020_08130 [Haliangiales bacterium]
MACVVAAPPPNEPPPPPAEPVSAEPPEPAAPVADEPAHEPVAEPAYPQERPNERVPVRRPSAPTPPTYTPPTSERPNERVPVRRRERLGPIAKLSIEPTAGPVGTTVIVYGDFRSARRANQVRVSFTGARRPVRPVYVSADRVAVVVPRGARSGPVKVQVARRQAWAGRFAVIPSDGAIFVPTPVDEGLLGAVYQLPPQTRGLPNFDSLGEPFATIVVPSLKVAPRRFEQGFPGLQEAGAPLLEWFAIRFIGMISVPATGQYDFRVNSDDGSRLYIDGKLVVDNDGQHAPRAREGSITLTEGTHDIVVEYYQGPRFQIALELSWRRGNNQQWQLVPPSAFARYVGDNDCSDAPAIFCCTGNAPECRACRRKAQRVEDRWRERCDVDSPPRAPAPGPGPGPGIDCSQPPQRVCCQANSASCRSCRQLARQEREAWGQQCSGGSPSPPPTTTPPPINCQRPPQRVCCQSNNANCRRCRREARREREAWTQRCNGGSPPTTTPPPINCQRPPQRACCQSQTPQCRSCRDQAAAERAAWQQRCAGNAPGTPAPGGPPVDCSQPPQRMCCQAQTPQCQSCRQQAATERAQWNQQCQSTPPPGAPNIDCSKPPQIQPCCKALTPRCRACASEARAKREAYRAQCGN